MEKRRMNLSFHPLVGGILERTGNASAAVDRLVLARQHQLFSAYRIVAPILDHTMLAAVLDEIAPCVDSAPGAMRTSTPQLVEMIKPLVGAALARRFRDEEVMEALVELAVERRHGDAGLPIPGVDAD